MARFYLTENAEAYSLSGSLGTGTWLRWKKDDLSLADVLCKADEAIGRYLREHSPNSIRYIVDINEIGTTNTREIIGA